MNSDVLISDSDNGYGYHAPYGGLVITLSDNSMDEQMKDRLLKDLLLGFVKLHILHHSSISPIFGQKFRNELKRHGYEMSFGTLYPTFHSLVEHGYLKMNGKNVGGKIRKYYVITAKGRDLLKEGKAKAKELTDELFES